MNKKTVVLIVAFVGCWVPSLVKAQEIKVTKSPDVVTGDELTVDFVIAGQAANSIYAYRRLEKGMELYKFDKTSLKLLDKKEISFKLRDDATKTRTPDLNKVLVLKDHIFVFTDLYYKGDNESSLYARRFDFNLNPFKEWQKVEYINTEISAHPGMFLITPSADSTKILIVKTESITNNKGNEKLSFTVLNSKLSWVSGKDQELKYADTRTNVAGYKIADNGTVYVMVKVDDEKAAGYKLCRFTLTTGNEYTASEFDLQLPGKVAVDITCEINKVGDLRIAGLYSNTGADKINGIFSAWIMHGSDEVLPVYAEINNFADVKVGVNKMTVLPDNTIVLFAEENYEKTDGACYKNSLHCFKVLADGTLAGNNTVHKQSKAVEKPGMAYLSFFGFTSDRTPILLYNEHKKNLDEGGEYKELTAEQKDNKRVLVYATFTGDKTNRTELLGEGEERVGFIPQYSLQTSATETLMLGKRGENYVLYKLEVINKEELVSAP